MNRYRTEPMEIQPRSFGDSLSDLINMLGKVWRPLLMPALGASVVVALVSYFVLTATRALDFFDLALNNPDAIELMPTEELTALIVDFFVGMIWVGIASAVVYGFLYLVAARAVAEEVAIQPSGSSVVAAAFSSMLIWIIALAMIAVGTVVGFVLLIVPGIWFAIGASMTAPVIAIEGLGPVGAIKRSFDLVKGSWWQTLGFLTLIGLIGGTASQLIQVVAVPLFLVGSPSFAFGVTIAIGVAVQGVIIAAIGVGMAVWYLSLRAKADGPFVLQNP